MLRFHGSRDKQTFTEVGYNSRLDELQAAVLRVLLPELDGWNEARRAAAAAYEREGLGDHVATPFVAPGVEHAYHLYVVRSAQADELAAALGERGIGARQYYRVPVHRQPVLRSATWTCPAPSWPRATHLALPMGTQLTDEQVREVVAACASGST